MRNPKTYEFKGFFKHYYKKEPNGSLESYLHYPDEKLTKPNSKKSTKSKYKVSYVVSGLEWQQKVREKEEVKTKKAEAIKQRKAEQLIKKEKANEKKKKDAIVREEKKLRRLNKEKEKLLQQQKKIR